MPHPFFGQPFSCGRQPADATRHAELPPGRPACALLTAACSQRSQPGSLPARRACRYTSRDAVLLAGGQQLCWRWQVVCAAGRDANMVRMAWRCSIGQWMCLEEAVVAQADPKGSGQPAAATLRLNKVKLCINTLRPSIRRLSCVAPRFAAGRCAAALLLSIAPTAQWRGREAGSCCRGRGARWGGGGGGAGDPGCTSVALPTLHADNPATSAHQNAPPSHHMQRP